LAPVVHLPANSTKHYLQKARLSLTKDTAQSWSWTSEQWNSETNTTP